MANYNGYLQLDLVGSAGGQIITNTLYYGNNAGDSFAFNDAFMAQFAAAWNTQHAETLLGEQTTRYTLQQLEVRAINEQGKVISDNAAELLVGQPGDIDAAIPGPGLVAILSIKTSSNAEMGSRALKRSYIAWGPVPSSFITDPTGELTLVGKAAYATIAALIGTSVTMSGLEYVPVRIGDTASPAQPAIGTIVSVGVKPFVQPRKSRFPKPDGT